MGTRIGEGRRLGQPPALTILHLVTDLRRGGTQVLTLERTRSAPFRHAVLAFAEHTGQSGEGPPPPNLRAAFAEAGTPVYLLGLRTPWEVLQAFASGRLRTSLRAALEGIRPDLVHSTLFHTHILGNWIARTEGIPHLASKEGTDDWMSPLHRGREARALSNAAAVAAVSKAAAKSALRLGVPAERIRVIPNGIDPARPGSWTLPEVEPRAGDAPRSVPPFRLLGVGRLDPAKGWEDLFHALPLVRRSHPGVVLDLLGSGTRKARVRYAALARRLQVEGMVRWHPDRQGQGTVATSSATEPKTILVVPSREEGFGLILLEGMARGLPIVATAVGGIPEVVRPEREALLVPPRDPRALAEACLRLASDHELTRRLVENARLRVLEFSLERMLARYEEAYREIWLRSRRGLPPLRIHDPPPGDERAAGGTGASPVTP